MASSPVKTRQETEAVLRSMAAGDRAFREELAKNPHAAIRQAVGLELPDHIKVTVLEETARQIYLVLPAAPDSSAELTDAELAAVSGGVAPGPPERRFEKARAGGAQGAIIPPFNPGGFNPSGGG